MEIGQMLEDQMNLTFKRLSDNEDTSEKTQRKDKTFYYWAEVADDIDKIKEDTYKELMAKEDIEAVWKEHFKNDKILISEDKGGRVIDKLVNLSDATKEDIVNGLINSGWLTLKIVNELGKEAYQAYIANGFENYLSRFNHNTADIKPPQDVQAFYIRTNAQPEQYNSLILEEQQNQIREKAGIYTYEEADKLTDQEIKDILTPLEEENYLARELLKEEPAKILDYLIKNYLFSNIKITGKIDTSKAISTSNNTLLNKYLYKKNPKYNKAYEVDLKSGTAFLTLFSEKPNRKIFITKKTQAIIDIIVDVLLSKTGKSLETLAKDSPFNRPYDIQLKTIAYRITGNKKTRDKTLLELAKIIEEDAGGVSFSLQYPQYEEYANYTSKTKIKASTFYKKQRVLNGFIDYPKDKPKTIQHAFLRLNALPITAIHAYAETQIISLPEEYNNIENLTNNIDNYLLKKAIFNRISTALDKVEKNPEYELKNFDNVITIEYILESLDVEKLTERKQKTLYKNIETIFNFYKDGIEENGLYKVLPLIKTWYWKQDGKYNRKLKTRKVQGFKFELAEKEIRHKAIAIIRKENSTLNRDFKFEIEVKNEKIIDLKE